MSSYSIKSSNSSRYNDNNLASFWKKGWEENRPLRFTVIFSAVLFVATLFGMFVDSRTVIGEPVWLKPTKFAISSVFYAASLMWVLAMLKDRARLVSIVSWVTAIAMIGELVLIVIQAFRGVRSHFNMSTALDGAIFSIMGIMILSLWIVSIVALVALFRQKFENRAWGAILKWALLITVVGSGLGGTMTSPRSSQLEAAQKTGSLPESGAHTIGAPDGGEGLPGVGWSTEGGDLRIGHFLGLHALQIVPILGLAILWLARGRSENQQTNLIHVASLGYLGTIALITWQAFRGEPLIYPSSLTLTTAGAFLLLLTLAAGLILTTSRPSPALT
ncbi:MAG: hypothetical protein AB8G95_26405 [Anaerolineae bacterium]